MEKKKLIDNPVVAFLHIPISFLIIYYVGAFLGSFTVYIPMAFISDPALQFGETYLVFIGIWIAALAYWAIFKRNRPLYKTMGPGAAGNNWKTSVPLGLVLGLGFNLLLAFIAIACGNISLTFNRVEPLYILYFIVVVFIQSSAEEVLCRIHLYQHLRRLFPNNAGIAIVGNALIFSMLHLNNPGVTPLALLNILLTGILYSLVVYYFDSFWACAIAHAGWNFCQNILLGLPNSGLVSEYSVFTLNEGATDGLAYSVNFGIEGTVTTVIFMALACVAVLLIGRRRNRRPLDIWAVPAAVTKAEN